MQARDSQLRYGLVAMSLHWLIAGLILFMIGFGYYLSTLSFADARAYPLTQIHKSIGLGILVLSLARLVWRLINPVPPLPDRLGPAMKILARLTHVLLYVAIIAIPLSGWAMVSASPLGLPTSWFGLFDWPHLPFLSDLPYAEKKELVGKIYGAHEVLAYGTAALLALHVGAALMHHLLLRDDTLRKMLPWARLQGERS